MALGTALYGFVALWISFRLACNYFPDRWAFLATLGIWFASSLPVYMYFNPSWAHAQSAFAVSLFLWYWNRSRNGRTWKQWAILGVIGGLMLDVYYINVLFLLFPLLESLADFWRALRVSGSETSRHILLGNILFASAIFVAFLPTLIVKRILYGSYLTSGYEHLWSWTSPAFFKVPFSSEHGLFSWTPIVLVAVVGLFFLRRHDPNLGLYSIVVFAAFLYTVGCYADWHGLSSFGSRFFVSLTTVFILGLTASFDWFARIWNERRAAFVVPIFTALFIVWNMGLMFQWGTHLIPARGPISWRDAAYNQVAVVPVRAASTLANYLTQRRQLMRRIEEEDVERLRSQPAEDSQ
jgi:hypothetical protein